MEGMRTSCQEVRTSYMALGARRSERHQYGHHRGAAGKERRVDKERKADKRQAAQEDMESR